MQPQIGVNHHLAQLLRALVVGLPTQLGLGLGRANPVSKIRRLPDDKNSD